MLWLVLLQDEVKNILTDMMANINKLEPQPITSPLNPGSICLGRYSPEKILCRAIVMNVMDDKVKLYFADFGNSEILPYSEIFQIPPQDKSKNTVHIKSHLHQGGVSYMRIHQHLSRANRPLHNI
ncbi:hypothetical protein J6590_042390 [Homalodisca vitripennis]|nr:hypothetical protein J6590_042390 [Homalodisca vitripennis]